jgi:hypothetical protein
LNFVRALVVRNTYCGAFGEFGDLASPAESGWRLCATPMSIAELVCAAALSIHHSSLIIHRSSFITHLSFLPSALSLQP